MSVVALGSLKSSPGVTTAAIVLARAWPAPKRILVVECDPAGGDIAARSGRAPEPGLVGLAAAGRRELSAEGVAKFARSFDGVDVVCAPSGIPPATEAVRTLAGRLPSALRELDGDVLIDCGRMQPGSPSMTLVEQADVTLLVVRPNVAEIARVVASAQDIPARKGSLALLLIGKASAATRDIYPAREVRSTVNLPVAGVLAHDAAGAETILGGSGSIDSALLRTAAAVAQRVLHFLGSGEIEEVEEKESS